MTREELEAALAYRNNNGLVLAAARERLAQLPPYPPETVEKIAKALYGWPAAFYDDLTLAQVTRYLDQAVAVLDALGENPKESPKDFHETQGRAWGGNL